MSSHHPEAWWERWAAFEGEAAAVVNGALGHLPNARHIGGLRPWPRLQKRERLLASEIVQPPDGRWDLRWWPRCAASRRSRLPGGFESGFRMATSFRLVKSYELPRCVYVYMYMCVCTYCYCHYWCDYLAAYLVTGIIDAFYLDCPWLVCFFLRCSFPLFLSWKPKENKGNQRNTIESTQPQTKGNQRIPQDTKGKMRSSKKNLFC